MDLIKKINVRFQKTSVKKTLFYTELILRIFLDFSPCANLLYWKLIKQIKDPFSIEENNLWGAFFVYPDTTESVVDMWYAQL